MSVSANPIATGWLNENLLREYPFHEGCGLRPNDSTGTLVENGWSLPNCLIVDMSVSIGGSNFDPFLYLGQMSVIDRSVTLVFCDRDGAQALSLHASSGDGDRYVSYQMSGMGSFIDARGVICIGDIDKFFDQTPDGLYRFSPEETRIEPTCIRPSAAGVRSLRAMDASGYMSLRLSGDVSLVAGENIRFDYHPDDNSLWISADPNSGYVDKCDCATSGQSSSIRTINGMSVDHLTIAGDGCMQVSADNGIIRMTDECAKPCCGCAETTFINQTINDLQTSMKTLSGNVSSLSDRLTAFVSSYVLSRKTLA